MGDDLYRRGRMSGWYGLHGLWPVQPWMRILCGELARGRREASVS